MELQGKVGDRGRNRRVSGREEERKREIEGREGGGNGRVEGRIREEEKE